MSAIIVIIKALSLIFIAVASFLSLAVALGAEPFTPASGGCANTAIQACFFAIV